MSETNISEYQKDIQSKDEVFKQISFFLIFLFDIFFVLILYPYMCGIYAYLSIFIFL